MQISLPDDTTSSSEGEDLSVVLTPTSETSLSHDDVEHEWLFGGSLHEPEHIATAATALVSHRGKLWCTWTRPQDSGSPISWTSLNCNGTWGSAREVAVNSGASNRTIWAIGIPAIANLNGVLHMVFIERRENPTSAERLRNFQGTLVHLQFDDESQAWGRRASLGVFGASHRGVDPDTPALIGYRGQLVCVYRSSNQELNYLTWDDVNGWSHEMALSVVMSRNSRIALWVQTNKLILLSTDRGDTTSIIRGLGYYQDQNCWIWTPDCVRHGVGSVWSERFMAYRDDHDHLVFQASLGEHRQKLQRVHSEPCWNAPAVAALNGNIVCIWDGGPSDGKQLLWSQRLGRSSIVMDKWMSRIDSDTYLSELSIPGSHESCANIQVPWVQCQHMTIDEQLNAGIRYFDFRCGVSFGKLYLFHGRSPLGFVVNDVLGKMYSWLDQSSNEAIMLQVKMEGGSGDESVFETLFLAELTLNAKHWALGNAIPKLGAVRGKIQLMRRFHLSSGTLGIDVRRWADNSPNFTIPLVEHERLVVQDQYEFTDVVPTFGELIRTKSKAVTALILAAKRDENCRAWYLNWCNAYALPLSLGVIATPADIAIGRNDFESGGSRHFVPGVNASLYKGSFSTSTKGRFGTILLDYAETPAPDLVSSIVMTNTFIYKVQ